LRVLSSSLYLLSSTAVLSFLLRLSFFFVISSL
jgi:hypothetical protein